jgi:type II secretory pathway pseudopilin PulG
MKIRCSKRQHESAVRPIRTRRKAQRGFTIAEIALSLIVFAMMAMMFGAVFPMAVRGAQYGSNYAQATLVAQHKMDQLRSAGYNKLVLPDTLKSLNIIDSTTTNVDGSYNFAAADNLTSTGTVQGYFPTGSTGTVAITDYHLTDANVPAGKIALIKVKVAWSGGGVSSGFYTLSTMISQAGQP